MSHFVYPSIHPWTLGQRPPSGSYEGCCYEHERVVPASTSFSPLLQRCSMGRSTSELFESVPVAALLPSQLLCFINSLGDEYSSLAQPPATRKLEAG